MTTTTERATEAARNGLRIVREAGDGRRVPLGEARSAALALLDAADDARDLGHTDAAAAMEDQARQLAPIMKAAQIREATTTQTTDEETRLLAVFHRMNQASMGLGTGADRAARDANLAERQVIDARGRDGS